MMEGKGYSLVDYSWLIYWGVRRMVTESDSVGSTTVSYLHLNFWREVWWPDKKHIVHIYDIYITSISLLFIRNFLWGTKCFTIHVDLVELPITVYLPSLTFQSWAYEQAWLMGIYKPTGHSNQFRNGKVSPGSKSLS